MHLLIIDDDEVDRAAVRRALTAGRAVFELVEADSADAGLACLCGETTFDCVLLDYLLPGRTGLELLAILRERLPVLPPIVVLTGHGDETLAVALMKAGASDYISKSALNPARLVQSIMQAIRLHRAEEEKRLVEHIYAKQLRALADAAVDLNVVLSAEAVSQRIAASAQSLVNAEMAVARIARKQKHGPLATPDDAETFAAVITALPQLRRPIRVGGADAQQPLSAIPELAALIALGLPEPHKSWLAAPLIGRSGHLLGLLHCCDAHDADAFTDNDEAILVQLAQMASIAIENAWLFEDAEAAVRARDDMISIVSHDLRNPLNAIVMATALLESQSFSPPKMTEMVQRISRAAFRMNGLVDDLLDVTKIDAGTLTISPRPESLNVIIEEALDQIRPTASTKTIRISDDVPADLPNVPVDRHRLLQVLSNLLGNALKFTPDGGSIDVSVEPRPDAAYVHIEDSGQGIPPESLPKLFDRFWQASQTSSLGAGLGLFIAKGIVEAHGGTITVDSVLNVGTTFSFSLPWIVDPTAKQN